MGQEPVNQWPGTPVRVIPAQILETRKRVIHERIAMRAFEIFDSRGRVDGHDLEDWKQAESAILYACPCDVSDYEQTVVVRSELPVPFTASELKVCVEPRSIVVIGERMTDAIFGDFTGSHVQLSRQTVFREQDLPVEVDPRTASAILTDLDLEVAIRKVARSP